MGTKKRHLGLLALSLALAGALLLWAFVPDRHPPWSMYVDALLHDKARYTGRLGRVRGTLVPGTLVQRDTPCRTRFDLEYAATTLHVNYPECAVPDNFRDGAHSGHPEVTAEGVLQPDGHFEASKLLVRSGGPYEMRQRPWPLEKLTAPSEVRTFPSDR